MPLSQDLTLGRRPLASPWRVLAVRAALATALLVTAFCLLWFDRDGIKDQIDGHLTFGEVIYFTMITITTVGYGDIVPVSEKARLIDAFLITPIRLFIWLIFLGTAVDLVLKRSWERWRMKRIQSTLCGHFIIAGFGRNGSRIAEELMATGVSSANLVAIDCTELAVESAKSLGIAAMQGDATSNEVLAAVHIERARALIVAAGRDDTSILVVLTARSMAPDCRIGVAIHAADNEELAVRAGATQVINPIRVAARLLAAGATESVRATA